MGLETVHPEVLPRLNKKMDVRAFEHAVGLLSNNHVPVRAFILLRPPFLSEREGIDWAKKSIRFAFDVGVECCAIIPVRAGNGAMDWLRENHYFHPPAISSLEEVLDFGLGLGMGRVFADLWDLEQFSSCEHCFEDRKYRLNHINLYQEPQPGITCSCQESYWA
jgi:radical SAM enzyme (TIGR01210 family)